MAERYVHLQENLYYDSKDKVIVRNMGNRYVFVRHDRRMRSDTVKDEKRAEARAVINLKLITGNLYFDCKTLQLYKRVSGNMVLYSKDRRKVSKRVAKERRIGAGCKR